MDFKNTIPRVKFKFKETEALRNTPVDELVFASNMYVNSLKRGGMNTLGDVLDNWNDISGAAAKYGHAKGLNPSLGASKVQHIKASVFSYMVREGYIDLAQKTEVLYGTE